MYTDKQIEKRKGEGAGLPEFQKILKRRELWLARGMSARNARLVVSTGNINPVRRVIAVMLAAGTAKTVALKGYRRH